jgi:hypothetical protein
MKRRYEMASKRIKSQGKSGAGANPGRQIKKATFGDLETKDGQKISGGKWSRENGSVSSPTSTS